MNQKILITSDHAGFTLKETLIKYLSEVLLYDVEDMGPYVVDQDDDYPDFVIPFATRMGSEHGTLGIVIGWSGQGEAMVSNRIPGVRAAVFYGGDENILTLSKEHNNANVLSLGAHFLSKEDAMRAVEVWLSTQFSYDERHIRRLKKFDRL